MLVEEKFSNNIGMFIFFSLVFVRILSSIIIPISDCDEVFNYWEPIHYLLYQKGFQTWEYSPEYALRSYLFLLPYFGVGKIASLNGIEKIGVFFLIRMTMGLFCSICETFFLYGVYSKFGKNTTIFTWISLLFSSGMFFSSASFLPSTFVMYILMITMGIWLSDNIKYKYPLIILTSGICAIIGWPFCIIAILPIAIDTILKYGFIPSLNIASIVSIGLLSLTSWIDSFYYKRIFFTPINLLMYNKGSGSEKYGTEPFSFYFKNLTLNFNIMFWISLISPTGILSSSKFNMKNIIYIIPFHIWFFFFSFIKHKEERFLFVIYPILCLSAGIFCTIWWKKSKLLIIFIFSIFILFSISRTSVVMINYNAPIGVYSNFYFYMKNKPKTMNQTICVGKEWYRFPSSFFLHDNFKLLYLKSEFNGLLPKYFEKENGTSIIPTEMNDQNEPVESRYSTINQCDYLIDLELNRDKIRYYEDENFEKVLSMKFLDAESSPSYSRAFYNPFWHQKNVYKPYYLLKNKNLKD
eukprot:gene179-4425_t